MTCLPRIGAGQVNGLLEGANKTVCMSWSEFSASRWDSNVVYREDKTLIGIHVSS